MIPARISTAGQPATFGSFPARKETAGGATAFCNHYRHWLATQEVVLRQVHTPGDKLLVDYAGQTMPVVDRFTGEVRHAQLFVAVLGCSNYTYADATWSQALPDCLGSHGRALSYFGGAPRAIVPDDVKSAVTRAHSYEPNVNAAYQVFAEHYGVAILPARVRKPRDKAKVEAGVFAEREQLVDDVAYLLIALCGYIETPKGMPSAPKQLVSKGADFVDAFRAAYLNELEAGRYHVLQRAADLALGEGAAEWFRTLRLEGEEARVMGSDAALLKRLRELACVYQSRSAAPGPESA